MRRQVNEARCGLWLWLSLTLGAGCASQPGEAGPNAAQESHREAVDAQVVEPASEAEPASANKAYSVIRTLNDYRDDGGYMGKTRDSWTCREDETCTSSGAMTLEYTDGLNVVTAWKKEYDAAGRVARSGETVWEDGRQVSKTETEYTPQAVTETTADGKSRALELPDDFRDCRGRCRDLVRDGNAAPDHCYILYPEGFLQYRLSVRPLLHPTFGMVYEQRTRKPGESEDRRRIVDANCQQLEAHAFRSHSKLLTEERTGAPNVPPYQPDR